jgi:4-amino-4-deoxy-L-arabinose transferase-like glycosyltransferase
LLAAAQTRHHAHAPTVTSSPATPALVSQSAAVRLPRIALLLLCAAYVLPGLFGRDPWRNADQTAFGYMLAMAEGRTPWLTPTLGGLAPDNALAPHWLGAASVALLSPWIDAPLAARIPFGLLLATVLVLTWYACYHLARTEAAQPVAFAFGGEAATVDYARAIADGALLALIATLGLLQLGHETTPELAQLFAASLALWAVAAAPYRHWQPRLAVLLALPLLSACGAPMMALLFGVALVAVTAGSGYQGARGFMPWVAAATALAALCGVALRTWAWRIGFEADGAQLLQLARLFVWFLWPAWLLALWTLWRWRHHWTRRHIAAPLSLAAVALVACVAGGGFDRALMIGLPGFAVLAAFALPTLRRGTASAIDWFSVFFFTVAAIAIWVVYLALVTGVPAKPAANVARLAPGFEMHFSLPALLLAVLATLAWGALVRWRTGRHRPALWKSLVLPAGGVALAWLLLMTLWLPLLDYARSNRPWVARLAPHVPAGACIAAPGLPRPSIAALEQYGRWRVRAVDDPGACAVLLRQERRGQPEALPTGWRVVARVSRPTDREETTLVLRREP